MSKPKCCVLVITALCLVLLLGTLSSQAAEKLRIGITQIAEHPSLDAAREGFVDALAESGYVAGENVTYDFHNAQGDMSTAITIARKFVDDRVDMILAIATPTAQAAANATSDIPILITAVTDPVAAGLVDSIERPGTNVTGTSDLTPVEAQLRLLVDLAPEARRVGIVYNAGETNSLVQVDVAEKAARELGLKLIKSTASNSSEVFQAAKALVGRVDAVYVPTDNTVVSALESVIMVCEDNNLPLIVGEGDSVDRGGMATIGIDYYQLGYQTGLMAAKVIAGADPAETPIEYLQEANLIINLTAARNMNIVIPEELLEKADRIVGESD